MAGGSEIYEVRLVCPSAALPLTNFAARLSTDVSESEREGKLRDMI